MTSAAWRITVQRAQRNALHLKIILFEPRLDTVEQVEPNDAFQFPIRVGSVFIRGYLAWAPPKLKLTFGGVSEPAVAWKYGFGLNPIAPAKRTVGNRFTCTLNV